MNTRRECIPFYSQISPISARAIADMRARCTFLTAGGCLITYDELLCYADPDPGLQIRALAGLDFHGSLAGSGGMGADGGRFGARGSHVAVAGVESASLGACGAEMRLPSPPSPPFPWSL